MKLDRLETLDLIRGLALIFVILINAQYFTAQPPEGLAGLQKSAGDVLKILFDGKAYAAFALLFGGGIVLFIESARAKGLPALDMHARRMLALAAFGLVDAYLIWHWDVLFTYAVLGGLLVWVVHWQARSLLMAAALVFYLPWIFPLIGSLEPVSALADAYKNWVFELSEQWRPLGIYHDMRAYTSDFSTQVAQRVSNSLVNHFWLLPNVYLWEAGGMALLGMALIKEKRFLRARWSASAYAGLAFVGLLLGTALAWYTLTWGAPLLEKRWAREWGQLLIPLHTLGWIALAMLLYQQAPLPGFGAIRRSLQAFGRMAFTSYMASNIAFSLVFYGHGLGLYGQVGRFQQYMIAGALIVTLIICSTLWLRHFAMGPLEAVWRRFTYAGVIGAKARSVGRIAAREEC